MRRGFLIDARGQLWPAARPDHRSAGGSVALPAEAGYAPGILYIGPAANGIEVALCGEGLPARTLAKALHLIGLLCPKRIALTQFEEGGAARVTIFPGVWEFAGYAETLAPEAASGPEPRPEASGTAAPGSRHSFI
ncbi:MAG: hypothetical protein ACLQJR_22050 [Stellaceae bacterium]